MNRSQYEEFYTNTVYHSIKWIEKESHLETLFSKDIIKENLWINYQELIQDFKTLMKSSSAKLSSPKIASCMAMATLKLHVFPIPTKGQAIVLKYEKQVFFANELLALLISTEILKFFLAHKYKKYNSSSHIFEELEKFTPYIPNIMNDQVSGRDKLLQLLRKVRLSYNSNSYRDSLLEFAFIMHNVSRNSEMKALHEIDKKYQQNLLSFYFDNEANITYKIE